MNLNLTTATRYGLNVLAAFGASMALYFGKSIFIPLTIAGLLAAMLWPWANWMHRRVKLPWFLASFSAIGLLVFIVLLVVSLVVVSIPQILNDLPNPNNKADIQRKYTALRNNFTSTPLPFLRLNEVLPEDVDDAKLYQELLKYLGGQQITADLLTLGGNGMHLLAETTLVLFTLLFLLLEGQMLIDKVRNIFGPGLGIQSSVSRAFRDMAESIRSYLVWRTIVNIGLGIVLGVVYHFVGLKQAVLWALLTVILGYIPYLGTIAAGVMPTLDALVSVGPVAGLGVLLFYIAIVTVEGYIIVPWVMGRSMDLNATTVLISCLFWYLVWGTAGLFLAMPLMAAIRAVCANVPGWAAWGELMSSEHTPPPPVDEGSKAVIDLSAAPPPATSEATPANREPKASA
ncbi:MAG: AI-2E family transporter [Fimbriiglobus sp.]|jgi:predicted PurR-regulated permease PerM|nr:AI-2E family transporter [Fimbriiglobus sp.]